MDWLSRKDIDQIIEAISADDLIESMSGTGSQQGLQMVKGSFNRAAARMGIEDATTRVRIADFKYMAERIGEVVDIDSPLSGDTESLLASADTGG
jgi:hypothetical protein